MTNWEIANELYKAKKCYDSIWFIKENELQIIQPNKHLNEQLNIFFIQLCTVIDKCFSGNIEQLKHTDDIIEKIKYERNKHSAHTDEIYDKNHTLKDITSLKSYIIHVYQLIKSQLPSSFTLDFVCYDKSLFRQIHKISPDIEKLLRPIHYYMSDKDNGNIDNIPNISEEHLYTDMNNVLYLQNGLTNEENIQNTQDFLMKCHIDYDNSNENDWWDSNEILNYFKNVAIFKNN